MRLLVRVLTLLFLGSSVAAADDGPAPGLFHGAQVQLMRALVPADELDGHQAFHVAMSSPGPLWFHYKEEHEQFGSEEGQTDYADAVAEWQALAQNGDPEAMNNLGVMYLNAGDRDSGTVWLSRAVARGYGLASHNLERLYQEQADDAEFEEWFWNTAVAEATGWPPVPDGPEAAYNWFYRAADKGYPAEERKRALAEAAKKASTTRWVMSFVSAPEHELQEEAAMLRKIGRSLCQALSSENDFERLQKILRNSSKRSMGRELKLERAYKHIRCYEFNVGDVDLIRVAVENPVGSSLAVQELVHYFTHEIEERFLLGSILMCRRDYGFRCTNVLEHIERNLNEAISLEWSYRAAALRSLERLFHNNLDENHLTYDRGFCRTWFPETPKHCYQ